MSTNPSKRMGRPRKSALEKGEQFSIRLPLMAKLNLEILARSLNLSLSQAVEYAIEKAASEHQIDGTSVTEWAQKGIRDVLLLMPNWRKSGAEQGRDGQLPNALKEPAFRALFFPLPVRDNVERFFIECLTESFTLEASGQVIDGYDILLLWKMANDMLLMGMSAEFCGLAWNGAVAARHAGESVFSVTSEDGAEFTYDLKAHKIKAHLHLP